MKLEENIGVVERFGVNNESNFRIKATGKAFRALSDTLYSDKPLAIVRELSANAYDAHAAVGKLDVPFEVHCPNGLEPHFSIRDFGPGLTPEEVQEIYTTYFESTKTSSNDYVGCLGLGSKSPFSYKDQFDVVSFKDGVRYTYSAYMNEEDVPSISLLDTSETDEPNGMLISLSVDRVDHSTFLQKIEKVYTYFKVKPIVRGSKVTFKEVTYNSMGNDKDWGFVNASGSGVRAVMGNIAYPIPSNFTNNLTAEERTVLDLDIDIFFNIGELEVSLSRESLSFKGRVIDVIRDRLKKIGGELIAQLEADIASAPNLWEASMCAEEKYRSTNLRPFYEAVRNSGRLTYNGRQLLNREVYVNIENKHPGLKITRFYLGNKRGYYSQYVPRKDNFFNNYIQLSKKSSFFTNDLNRGSQNRIFELLRREYTTSGTNGYNVYMMECQDDNVKAKFLNELGIDDSYVKPVSSLNKPKREKGEKQKSAQVLEYKYYSAYSSTANWKDTEIDLDDGGIYVELHRHDVVVDGVEKPTDYIYNLKNYLKAAGHDIDNVPIYGFRSGLIKKVKEDDNWQSITDYVKDFVQSAMSTNSVNDTKVAIYAANIASHSHISQTYDFLSKFNLAEFHQDSPFVQIINEYKEIYDIVNDAKLAALGNLITLCGYQIGSGKNAGDVFEKIVDEYPIFKMVKEIGSYYVRKQTDVLADYIRLVDSTKGKVFVKP